MLTKLKAMAGIAAGLLGMTALASDKSMLEKTYSTVWKEARLVEYAAPSQRELASMQRVFVRLLRGEDAEEVAAELQSMGWQARRQDVKGITWIIVSEMSHLRRGGGVYAFASKGRHALQAPHARSDRLTGLILLEYARDGLPRALAWNSVPRKTADMAHLDDTYFIAFSRAYAQVYPAEKILQLHGFDVTRRHSRAGAGSGAIISAAHANPSAELKSAVQCMRHRLEPDTLLYGWDVKELGGTTNRVAHALRNARYDGFIHVELSLSLREKLLGDARRRGTLLSCLGGN